MERPPDCSYGDVQRIARRVINHPPGWRIGTCRPRKRIGQIAVKRALARAFCENHAPRSVLQRALNEGPDRLSG